MDLVCLCIRGLGRSDVVWGAATGRGYVQSVGTDILNHDKRDEGGL